jgi:hypothetical protein
MVVFNLIRQRLRMIISHLSTYIHIEEWHTSIIVKKNQTLVILLGLLSSSGKLIRKIDQAIRFQVFIYLDLMTLFLILIFTQV